MKKEKEMLSIRGYNEMLKKNSLDTDQLKENYQDIKTKSMNNYFESMPEDDYDLVSPELANAAIEAVEATFGSWEAYCEDIRKTYN